MQYADKLNKLKDYLKNLERTVIAFSAGVDSTFLIKVAHDVLGDNVIAVTAKTHSFSKRELNEAINYCKQNNIRHIIADINELRIEGFSKNPPNRCYLCKKEIFNKILKIAENNNITYVLEGSNVDDDGDYRPGFQAIKELGVKSPLRETGFTKNEIRKLSEELGLSTHDKPSFACLASRFVYGETITEEKLYMVEKAEQLLFDLGFKQFRVRIHNNLARIEVKPEEFDKLLINKEKITNYFKEVGFAYTTMDLTGYRTGSMNETLKIN